MSNANLDEKLGIAMPTRETAGPVAGEQRPKKPTAARRSPKAAPAKDRPAKKTVFGKKASKGQRKPPRASRQGSKTADIIHLLEKAKGVTLAELMKTTGWQAHYAASFFPVRWARSWA